jgi:hypothetical protein
MRACLEVCGGPDDRAMQARIRAERAEPSGPECYSANACEARLAPKDAYQQAKDMYFGNDIPKGGKRYRF